MKGLKPGSPALCNWSGVKAFDRVSGAQERDTRPFKLLEPGCRTRDRKDHDFRELYQFALMRVSMASTEARHYRIIRRRRPRRPLLISAFDRSLVSGQRSHLMYPCDAPLHLPPGSGVSRSTGRPGPIFATFQP